MLELVHIFGDALRHNNNRRGLPLTPVQKVCIALNFFAGGLFQRIAGLCGGVSKSAAHYAIDEVRRALVNIRHEYIHFPTEDEMRDSARRLQDRFGIGRIAFGVDGTFIKLHGAPRKIPRGNTQQNYWCRKGGYAINVMVIGNDKKLILNLDCDWHGGAHDATVWKNSFAKRFIERIPDKEFLVVGDGAYPMSDVLVKPYSKNEARRDPRKRQFNRQLCALRTGTTENIYGMLKQRFPCLFGLRNNLPNAQKTIIACAVLHNMTILWHDEEPDPYVPPRIPPPDEDHGGGNEAAERRRGRLVRDNLLFTFTNMGRRRL